ncbi:MAG: NYN domain-containing protein [Phycisphaerae bacterium]|nr:NYN domain-containing protein [Phycisphaerae bacterium]
MDRKRVMIFIDGSNFYHALKSLNFPTNIDFKYLAAELIGSDRELVRVYYYNSAVHKEDGAELYEQQRRFFDELREIPYFEVKLGHLEHRPYGMVEKGADVLLAVDMVMFAARNLYDVAILVSADSDFIAAIQYVKDMGKHVEAAYPLAGKAFSIKQVCDRFIPLDKRSLRVKSSAEPGITANLVHTSKKPTDLDSRNKPQQKFRHSNYQQKQGERHYGRKTTGQKPKR